MKLTLLRPSRPELEARAGDTIKVVARFSRIGIRSAHGKTRQTVLLTSVREVDTGILLTDHLWLNRGNVWKNAGAIPGDLVTFEARSIEYRTGHFGPDHLLREEYPPRQDYTLTAPKEVQVVHRPAKRAQEAA